MNSSTLLPGTQIAVFHFQTKGYKITYFIFIWAMYIKKGHIVFDLNVWRAIYAGDLRPQLLFVHLDKLHRPTFSTFSNS